MSKFETRWKVTTKDKVRYFKHFHDAHKAAEELRAAGQDAEVRIAEPGEMNPAGGGVS